MTAKYGSMAAVKKAGELPPENRKQLHTRTCDQVYSTYKAVFDKACTMAMSPEEQYILYLRCGELYTMIRQKNGFATFHNEKKKVLHNTFKSVLSQMETLQKSLTKQFEDQQLAPVLPPLPEVPQALPQVETPAPESVSKVLIKPKDLIRIVEKEKKTAVILDFRSDQQSEKIKYTKGQVTVVSIPRETVTHGLIFGNLKNLIGVGERAMLSRVAATDYVVLMDDDTPSIVDGEAEKGSPAHTLKLAISDYNPQEKPRNAPLFMEGGMVSWRLQYPMYINRDEGAGGMAPVGDSLSLLIANYRKATVPVQYHDFAPKKVARPPLAELVREEVTVPNVPEPMLIEEGKKPDAPVSPPAESLTPNENTPAPQPELPNGPSQALPTPVIPPRPITPPRLAGGESAPKVLPGVHDLPIRDLRIIQPSVDRSNKPGEVVVRSVVMPTEAPTPPPRTAMPTVDRSAKPGLISENDQKMLMDIYRGMTDNIRNNSSRRSTLKPGQTGLYNMGNTCFMNACLQALFHTPHIVDVFTAENFIGRVNTKNALGTRGVISAVFSALVDNVWSGQFEAFRPQRFLQLFASEVNSMLMNGQQQDASEFYMILLASLHEDTNQVWKGVPPVQNYSGGPMIRKEAADFDLKQKNFSCSPISRTLYPRTVSEVTCATCCTQSITFEDMNIVQVGLPPESRGSAALTDCLRLSFSAHNLDGRWECPRCKVARPATQKLSLWSLPSVVVVHLLRFSFVNGDYVKNDIPVNFDTEHLDLAPYLHDGADKVKDSVYKLYSVTNHRGRLNSGHYTAFSRHLRTNEWLRCDDETVRGARASEIDFSAAYILYFKKRGL